MTLPDPPEGWALHNLVNLEPGWQVNLCDGEHIAIGTGDTPDDAMIAAECKIDCGEFVGRLHGLVRAREDKAPSSLLQSLGLLKQREPINRRI